MKISGEIIYRGSTSWGAPIATVKGEYVYKGTGFLTAPIAFGWRRTRLQRHDEIGWADCQRQRRRQNERSSGGGVLTADVTALNFGRSAASPRLPFAVVLPVLASPSRLPVYSAPVRHL